MARSYFGPEGLRYHPSFSVICRTVGCSSRVPSGKRQIGSRLSSNPGPRTGGLVRAQFHSGDGLNDALSPRLQRRV
jgi:hypothetical protein